MNPPIRPSERIRRSVIVPIQMGGSFLISLTSPLVSMASRMMGSRKQEKPPAPGAGPASPDQPMEIKLSKKPRNPGSGPPR
jgi:hypothetical protein